MLRGIGEELIAVVCALYLLCGASTKCHVPREAVLSKFPSEFRGLVKRWLKEAERQGLIYRKGGIKKLRPNQDQCSS